jgi:hypothetical protein
MSLEEAARSLLNDHDSNVADLESIGRRVTRWPEMEALRAALAVADTPTPNPWKDEVIEKLVISHNYKAEHENDPAKALHDLLSWEVAIALDPQVSSDAQALIDRGRNEAQEDAEPVAWHICDNIGALVTDDRKEASAARECGHTVRQLVFREPRRASAESAELSEAQVNRQSLKASECPPDSVVMLVSTLRRLGVLRAAGSSDEDRRDAERYRLVRRGQHWSVIDGIGDILRAETLDAAVDAVGLRAAGEGKG